MTKSPVLSLLSKYNFYSALFGWSKFSLTSYIMVSNLVKQGIQPKTVIDVGANVGQFCVASAHLFKNAKIHAFEPVPESFASLRKNVSKLNNVKTHALALGEQAGQIDFHVNSHSHSSSALPLTQHHLTAFPHAQEAKIISVPVSTLDNISHELNLVSPVLLKLDVQGYEANVLKGAVDTLKKVDYVLLEASFKPMYEGELLFTEIVELMQGYGFKFLRPIDFLADEKSGEILQIDALFQNIKHEVLQ